MEIMGSIDVWSSVTEFAHGMCKPAGGGLWKNAGLGEGTTFVEVGEGKTNAKSSSHKAMDNVVGGLVEAGQRLEDCRKSVISGNFADSFDAVKDTSLLSLARCLTMLLWPATQLPRIRPRRPALCA